MRCTFQVDGEPTSEWSEDLVLPPLPGTTFARDGRSYVVRAMDLGPWAGSVKSATFALTRVTGRARR